MYNLEQRSVRTGWEIPRRNMPQLCSPPVFPLRPAWNYETHRPGRLSPGIRGHAVLTNDISKGLDDDDDAAAAVGVVASEEDAKLHAAAE